VVSGREIIYKGTGWIELAVSQGQKRWIEMVWVQEVNEN